MPQTWQQRQYTYKGNVGVTLYERDENHHLKGVMADINQGIRNMCFVNVRSACLMRSVWDTMLCFLGAFCLKILILQLLDVSRHHSDHFNPSWSCCGASGAKGSGLAQFAQVSGIHVWLGRVDAASPRTHSYDQKQKVPRGKTCNSNGSAL